MTQDELKCSNYVSTFNATEVGTYVLGDLEDRFNLDKETFNKDSERLSCYLQGQRSVILYIKEQIKKGKEKL